MSRVVVLGGGESGVGSAVLAKSKGYDVFLSDMGKISDKYVSVLKEWEIPFEQGHHTEDLILNADEVIETWDRICLEGECPSGDSQVTDKCQHRLGKDSLVKDSVVEDNICDSSPTPSPKPTRHKYGMYKNVLFSDEDYKKLQEEFPHDYSERINRLSEYIASTGKSYKNHLATIRAWARKEKPAKENSSNPFLDMLKEEGGFQ